MPMHNLLQVSRQASDTVYQHHFTFSSLHWHTWVSIHLREKFCEKISRIATCSMAELKPEPACQSVAAPTSTGFSSEIGTKLRDWAVGQAGGQLLLSGNIVLK